MGWGLFEPGGYSLRNQAKGMLEVLRLAVCSEFDSRVSVRPSNIPLSHTYDSRIANSTPRTKAQNDINISFATQRFVFWPGVLLCDAKYKNTRLNKRHNAERKMKCWLVLEERKHTNLPFLFRYPHSIGLYVADFFGFKAKKLWNKAKRMWEKWIWKRE